MEWLLQFARTDLAGASKTLLKKFTDEAVQIRDEKASGVAWSGVYSDMLLEQNDGPRRALSALQTEIRRAFDQLQSGKSWVLPAIPTRVGLNPARIDVLEFMRGRGDEESRGLVWRFEGSFEAAFFGAVAEVLVAWWPALKPCAASDCRRLFLTGRQYCSPECSRKTRWQRFAPGRMRDYQEEYQQRLKKRHPTAKIRARHRAKR